MELIFLVLGLGVLAGVGFAIFLLHRWGRRVMRGRSAGWRATAWLPLASAAVMGLGLVTTVAALVRGFAAVGRAAPDAKSELLANAIDQAMVATYVSMPLAILGLAMSFVLFAYAASRPVTTTSAS